MATETLDPDDYLTRGNMSPEEQQDLNDARDQAERASADAWYYEARYLHNRKARIRALLEMLTWKIMSIRNEVEICGPAIGDIWTLEKKCIRARKWHKALTELHHKVNR